MRRRSAEVCVYVPTTVALYVLNHKRDFLAQLERRYSIHVLVARDDTLIPPAFRLERLRALEPGETATAVPAPLTQAPEIDADEVEEDTDEMVEADDAEQPEPESEEERVRARRRRRRRRRHEDERSRAPSAVGSEETEEPAAERVAASTPEADVAPDDEDDDASRLRRRRGRRGGRRRGRHEEGPGASQEIGRPAADTVEIVANDAGSSSEAAFELREGSPAVANGEMSWPETPVKEAVVALTVTEIEAASLPAFAGDAAPSENVPPGAELPAEEPVQPPSDIGTESVEETSYSWPAVVSVTDGQTSHLSLAAAAAADEQISHPSPAEELRGNGASALTELIRTSAERPPEGPVPDQANEGLEAHQASAFGVEPASEPNPETETLSELVQAVQEVTKKPENPRRGWWQRLIQS